MKKLFYTLLIVFACSMSFVSCTEDEVKPSNTIAPGTTPDPGPQPW